MCLFVLSFFIHSEYRGREGGGGEVGVGGGGDGGGVQGVGLSAASLGGVVARLYHASPVTRQGTLGEGTGGRRGVRGRHVGGGGGEERLTGC